MDGQGASVPFEQAFKELLDSHKALVERVNQLERRVGELQAEYENDKRLRKIWRR